MCTESVFGAGLPPKMRVSPGAECDRSRTEDGGKYSYDWEGDSGSSNTQPKSQIKLNRLK